MIHGKAGNHRLSIWNRESIASRENSAPPWEFAAAIPRETSVAADVRTGISQCQATALPSENRQAGLPASRTASASEMKGRARRIVRLAQSFRQAGYGFVIIRLSLHGGLFIFQTIPASKRPLIRVKDALAVSVRLQLSRIILELRFSAPGSIPSA